MDEYLYLKVGDRIKIKHYNIEVLAIVSGGKRKIRFLDTGFEKVFYSGNIRKGEIKDPTEPSIYGLACIGFGGFNTKHAAYKVWMNMLSRCYSDAGQGRNGASVCEYWLNYQNFAKWYESNYKPGYELDKDLSRCALYSEGTCFFLPKEINQYLNLSKGSRTSLVGVSIDNRNGKQTARCKNPFTGTYEFCGYHDSEHSAFLAYKARKEELIKLLANKYKLTITAEAYDALMQYKIEETD